MLTLAMLPVQAAPKTEQTFALHIEGFVTGWGEGAHAGPTKSEAQPYPIQRTYHAKATVFNFSSVTLSVDGQNFNMTEGDFEFDEEHSFNFNWNTLIGTSKAKDTITFYDSGKVWGTIEILVIDKMNFGDMPPSSEGFITGHGTGALKDVKIKGTAVGTHIPNSMVEPLPIWTILDREGTIWGWTSPSP